MSIGNIVKPWTFTNNTETADGTKVNSNFDVAISGVNDCINELNSIQGTKASPTARLAVSINDDGTIKAAALPAGTYDTRSTRVVDADDDLLDTDANVLVDTTAGDVTLTLLQAGATANVPTVINVGATGYDAIIAPFAGDTVFGLGSISILNGESVRIVPYGTNWWRAG